MPEAIKEKQRKSECVCVCVCFVFIYTLKTNVLKTTQPVLYFNTPVCQVKDNTFCVNFNSTSVIFFLTQVDNIKIFNTLMCHNDTNMTQIV